MKDKEVSYLLKRCISDLDLVRGQLLILHYQTILTTNSFEAMNRSLTRVRDALPELEENNKNE